MQQRFPRCRSNYRRCSIEKGVLKNVAKFTGKHLGQNLLLIKGMKVSACNFIKNETLAQAFSCKFCEIFKNTFFTEHLWVTSFDGDTRIFRNTRNYGKPKVKLFWISQKNSLFFIIFCK